MVQNTILTYNALVKKGFTLVELLVVVAILGVLAAVGIVSFSGYLGSAKENTTKHNFKLIEKYITSELIKCNLGDTNIFKRKNNIGIACNNITFSRIITETQYIFNTEKSFKSAFTNLSYVRNTGDSTNSSSIGSIHLNGPNHDPTWNKGATPVLKNNDIRLTSCFKNNCDDKNNNLSSVIEIE